MSALTDPVRASLEASRRLKREGNFRAARAELERALEAAPGHAVLLEALGQLHLAEGRVADAARVADDLLQRHPGSAGPIKLMGEVLLRQGRPKDAIEHFLEADRQVPSAYTAGLIVRALVKAREPVEAVRRAEESLQRYPEHPYLLSHLEVAYAESGQHEKAAQTCQRLLALKPQDPYAMRDLIRNRLAGLPPAEMEADLEAILRVPTYQRNPQVQKLAAEHHYKAGNFARAATAYREALGLAPGDRHAREQLGFCHYRQGEYLEAISVLEPFFQDDPANVYVRAALVGCYQKLGMAVELNQAFDRALAARPDLKQLHGVRKKALKGMGGG